MLMLFVGYMTAAEHVQVQVRDPQAVFKVCDSSDPGQQWQYQQVRHTEISIPLSLQRVGLTERQQAGGVARGNSGNSGRGCRAEE